MAAVVLSTSVTMLSGLLFFIAWADYGNQHCDHFDEAGWPGNNNCADAWWLMWHAWPVALVGLTGAWLGTRWVRHA